MVEAYFSADFEWETFKNDTIFFPVTLELIFMD